MLKPTPFWDELGCGGISREGEEGRDRVIGASGDRKPGAIYCKGRPATQQAKTGLAGDPDRAKGKTKAYH